MGEWEHEEVVVRQGSRSGLPVIVAVHSTALGPAVGGCRMWPYARWRDGLDDALRLSRAMTHKCAAAGLDSGGGKAVIPLAPNTSMSAKSRRNVLLDLGDIVASLAGRYSTGEDVGTTAADMLVVSERTPYVFCLPHDHGGIGEPAEPTAAGVYVSLRTTCRQLFGSGDLGSRRFAIHGLGQVGGRLARWLAAAGAELVVADVDPGKRDLAEQLGAEWVPPPELLHVPTDVLVPASLGGLLTPDVVDGLRCRAVVGPANNQLADDAVADRLAARGILWAPDVVVNAGGVIYGVLRELHAVSHEAAMAQVEGIGDALADVFATAADEALTPHQAVTRVVRRRLREAAAKDSDDVPADTGESRIEGEAVGIAAAGQRPSDAHSDEPGQPDERRSPVVRGDEGPDLSPGRVAVGVRATYDAVARAYDAELGDELDRKPLDRALLEGFAELAGTGTIADVGCGPGHVTRFLATRHPKVIGLDISPGMITVARERAPQLAFTVRSMLRLPAADRSWAGAVVMYSIIHLAAEERAAACREFARTIRPGGWLLVAFHIDSPEFAPGDVNHLTSWFGQPVDLDGYFLDPAEIVANLEAAGFAIMANLQRQPHLGAEYPSRRCYLLAQRSDPHRSGSPSLPT